MEDGGLSQVQWEAEIPSLILTCVQDLLVWGESSNLSCNSRCPHVRQQTALARTGPICVGSGPSCDWRRELMFIHWAAGDARVQNGRRLGSRRSELACVVLQGRRTRDRCALPQHEARTACRQRAGRVCAREGKEREKGREGGECCLGGRLFVGEAGEGGGGA